RIDDDLAQLRVLRNRDDADLAAALAACRGLGRASAGRGRAARIVIARAASGGAQHGDRADPGDGYPLASHQVASSWLVIWLEEVVEGPTPPPTGCTKRRGPARTSIAFTSERSSAPVSTSWPYSSL